MKKSACMFILAALIAFNFGCSASRTGKGVASKAAPGDIGGVVTVESVDEKSDQSILRAKFDLRMKAVGMNESIQFNEVKKKAENYFVYGDTTGLNRGERRFFDFLANDFKGLTGENMRIDTVFTDRDGRYHCRMSATGGSQWKDLADEFIEEVSQRVEGCRNNAKKYSKHDIVESLNNVFEGLELGRSSLGLFKDKESDLLRPVKNKIDDLDEILRNNISMLKVEPSNEQFDLHVNWDNTLSEDNALRMKVCIVHENIEEPLRAVQVEWQVVAGDVSLNVEENVTDYEGFTEVKVVRAGPLVLKNEEAVEIVATPKFLQLPAELKKNYQSTFEFRRAIVESGAGDAGYTKLVPVEGCRYVCGSDKEGVVKDYYKEPQSFDIGTFYLEEHEVTVAQYRRFLRETGRDIPKLWDIDGFNGDNQPVVGVTWDDAEKYCEWCKRRLPTECEWEYAFRSKERWLYPWGNEFKRGYTVAGGYYTQPEPVMKSGDVSVFNVYDLAGNVSEWCFDTHDKGEKIIRGASYKCSVEIVAGGLRISAPPGGRFSDVGFRCASDGKK